MSPSDRGGQARRVDPHLRETRASRRKLVRRVLRGGERAAQEGIPNYFGEFSALHSLRRVVHRYGGFIHRSGSGLWRSAEPEGLDGRRHLEQEAVGAVRRDELDADRETVAGPPRG